MSAAARNPAHQAFLHLFNSLKAAKNDNIHLESVTVVSKFLHDHDEYVLGVHLATCKPPLLRNTISIRGKLGEPGKVGIIVNTDLSLWSQKSALEYFVTPPNMMVHNDEDPCRRHHAFLLLVCKGALESGDKCQAALMIAQKKLLG